MVSESGFPGVEALETIEKQMRAFENLLSGAELTSEVKQEIEQDIAKLKERRRNLMTMTLRVR